jgi:hypothetical protein
VAIRRYWLLVPLLTGCATGDVRDNETRVHICVLAICPHLLLDVDVETEGKGKGKGKGKIKDAE